MPVKKILLSHGNGGILMHKLIKDVLFKKLNNPILKELSDSATIGYKEKIAFTTDSFVVSPLTFAGGDIGKLSVCGTVNDLVMLGAEPEYLSLGLIIEEGLENHIFEGIVGSIALNARKAGVWVVTGDLKVVEHGACDKIFINTSGIGRIIKNRKFAIKNIQPQDKIIITGNIGQHGLAVLAKRKDLGLKFNIKSDCAALNGLLTPIIKKTNAIRFMRDPTRGGVATTLNEIAQGRNLGIIINEKEIPISSRVKAASELLGIDPLYIANEGIAILVVAKEGANKVLSLLKKHPLGKNSRIIGVTQKEPTRCVVLNTAVGTQRIVEMLVSEPLPRIC